MTEPNHTVGSADYTADYELTLPDGRLLAWGEGGDPDGMPLLFMGGSPHSRWQAQTLHEAACKHGFRLIASERPGYGKSSPCPGGYTFASAAEDQLQLLEHLGIDRFAVAGVSGGCSYATAIAALAGVERCPLLVSISGQPPFTAELKSHLPGFQKLFYGLCHNVPPLGRMLGKLMTKAAGPGDRAPDAEKLARFVPPADVAVATDPAWWPLLARDQQAGSAQGPHAFVNEMAMLWRGESLPWQDLACKVLAFHGSSDASVSPRMAEHFAEQTNAEMVWIEGGGHLIAASNGEQMLEKMQHLLAADS